MQEERHTAEQPQDGELWQAARDHKKEETQQWQEEGQNHH